MMIFSLASAGMACAHEAPPAMSPPQAAAGTGLGSFSTGLGGQLTPRAGRLRIAVLPFTDQEGRILVLGRFLAELLGHGFGGLRQFELIEPGKVETELRAASATELLPDEKAVTIGGKAGADVLMVGTLTDRGDKIGLDCRILLADSGRVVAAANVDLPRDPDVMRMWTPSQTAPATN
jgi:hypothetical protein